MMKNDGKPLTKPARFRNLSPMRQVVWGILVLVAFSWVGCMEGPYTREELREKRYFESEPAAARSKYVEVRGRRIHFLEQGDGPGLLLIHGFPTSSYTWRHVLPRLARRYHVYAIDLVGYGRSMVDPSVDRGLGEQVGYLSDWMDAIGLQQAIIVGQDLGGGVAQMLAVKYPNKVRGLVLINSVCFDSWPYQYASLLAEPGFGPFVGEGAARESGFRTMMMQGVYHQKLLSDGVIAKYYEPWQGADGRRNLIKAARDQDNQDTQRIAEDLRSIRAPTLVIAGRFDPFQPLNYSRRLANAIPGASLQVLSECGHFASEDQVEKIVRDIFDFFRD